MKNIYLSLVLFGLLFQPAYNQVKINEIQSANMNTILDEDGDNEDWIEVINAGTISINLNGYGLSDNSSNLYKWTFPNTDIAPNEKMLVFASSKNRTSIVNHWETLVSAYDQWKYKVGSTTIPANWRELSFADGLWSIGRGGFGYGDNDDSTIVPHNTLSLYLRKTFTIIDTSAITSLILAIDYDDGFVAYINGYEIARSNVSGQPPAWNTYADQDHEAKMYSGGKAEYFLLSKDVLNQCLRNGSNVIAIQVHNINEQSNDMSTIPFLIAGISNSTISYAALPYWFVSTPTHLHSNFKIDNDGETIYLTAPGNIIADQKYIGNIQPETSIARIPDGTGNWCYTIPATPANSNNTNMCFNGFADKPVFSLAPGVYQGSQSVTISTSTPNFTIRYTLNGDMPNYFDPIYTGPITIDSTCVLRARAYSLQNYLPSQITTATYIINNSSTLPIISLSMDSFDLWDWNQGIYVMGPNASPNKPYKGANFWQDWSKTGHIEYFTFNGALEFSTDCELEIYGNYSRAKPQKSFEVKMKAYYGNSTLDYQLFPQRNITQYKKFVLRNAGSDWLYCHFIDELLHDLTYNDGIYSTAHKPVIVYLNGQYWGIYHLREKNDENFFAALDNVLPDSIDLIKVSDQNYVVNGNLEQYYTMYNFIANNDLANPINYNTAKSYWNIDNLTTYFATEFYCGNDDWMGGWTNNIKLYRPRKNGGKWNYILHDVDQGLINKNRNSLEIVLNYKDTCEQANIFYKLIQNTDFKKEFINRFADLLNIRFNPATMHAKIDHFRDEIIAEMPRAFDRWRAEMQSPLYMSDWNNAMNQIRNFVNERPGIVREQIRSQFQLQGQILLTLEAYPAGTGKIKINTIIPDTLPWSGIYFNGNPVTITAVAEPGYVFDYWEPCISQPFINTHMSFSRNFTQPDILRAHFKAAPDIAFTEINYNSDSTKNPGNWIELHNYGTTNMDLSSWKLKRLETGSTFTIPNGTILAPGQYLVLVEDTAKFNTVHPNVHNRVGNLGFGFSNKGGEIQLLNYNDNLIKSVHYTDSLPWPDCADGYGRTLELLSVNLDPNIATNWQCGCMFGSPGTGQSPCSETIIFSEVNYNSSTTSEAGDWVELKNIGSTPLNLSGWFFKDGDDSHTYQIPANTILNPGQYLVLVSSWQLFNSKFAFVNNKVGPFGFGLSGSSEAIRLFDQNGQIYISMVYHDSAPWTDSADGNGYTLELKYDNANPNLGSSWFAGCPGGSPGSAYTPNCATFSIEENKLTQPIVVYPNPAREQLYIDFKLTDSQNCIFQIFDLEGRILTSLPLENKSQQSVPISVYEPGFYFYRIIKENLPIQTGKIVIQ